MRSPISVKVCVAVTIWKLATNVEYWTLGFVWLRAINCWQDCFTDFPCNSYTHLLPQYVQIPNGDRLKEIVEGYETFWVFPQAAGAIDGSHIHIIRTTESASDYCNRKGYYSIIMQAMVEFRGLFMDVYIGWPGKVHDVIIVMYFHWYKITYIHAGSFGNPGRPSLPYTAMANEALPRDSTHYSWPRDIQLSSK